MVECQLPKLDVAGSSPVARSISATKRTQVATWSLGRSLIRSAPRAAVRLGRYEGPPMSIFRRDDQPEGPAQPVTPSAQPQRSRQQSVTLVASGSIVEGKIRGNSEVLIEGTLEGEVDLGSTLVIGESGKVIGDVVARSVRISGQLVGNVQALDKVELLPTGSIHGDVVSPRVAIAEGGFCKGKIEMGAKPREESVVPEKKGKGGKSEVSAAEAPKTAKAEPPAESN